MDSIDQYEALLKKWGYEDNTKAIIKRRAARAAQIKKIVNTIKLVSAKVSNLVSQIRFSTTKLSA